MSGNRRHFLSALAAASAAALLRPPVLLAAEPAPETTTLRLPRIPAVCLAPQYIADELLHGEGFKEIRFVDIDAADIGRAIGRNEVDFSPANPVDFLQALDGGAPIIVLGGIHIGCYELFAREGISSITELRGKTVGLKAIPPAQLILMAAQVGLDPHKDIIGRRRSPGPIRSGYLSTASSTRFSALHPNRRKCGRTALVMCWSAPRPTGRGPTTSAAWLPPAGSSRASTRWPPNALCALC